MMMVMISHDNRGGDDGSDDGMINDGDDSGNDDGCGEMVGR